MSNIYPYALLAHDPTTEIIISWIDATGDGGNTQQVQYAPLTEGASDIASAEPELVPNSEPATYLYHAHLTGLCPGTRYTIEINSSMTISHAFETLPAQMNRPIRLAVTSDHHPWRGGGMAMDGPGRSVMTELGSKSYDILLYLGDWVTHSQRVTHENTAKWLKWWKYYGVEMDQEKLHPRFAIPGNHDVARDITQTWNGRKNTWRQEDLTPAAGYFQRFHPNVSMLEPKGENYGSITIGDYLQLIALDTYSAFPVDQTDWLASTVDDTVSYVIPIFHTALLPGAKRGGNDHASKQQLLREEWAPILAAAENVRVTFNGDEHARKITHPWDVVTDAKPSDTQGSLELTAQNWLVWGEDVSNGIVGFGDGWVNSRQEVPDIGTDYLKHFSLDDPDERQFYTVELSASSTAITVTEWDETGDVLDTHLIDNTGNWS